jgi:methyltransferase-like protein
MNQSTVSTVNSYDQVPYPSHPFYQTHPDRLATVASLFGLQPPAPERSRVLELGCASGGNLIPLALTMPQSRFVGVDLSGRQIVDGRATVSALGLTNIDLLERSILEVGADLGEFDYILCHGVFSWVPRAVQEKILEICAGRLAGNGVAYVSYNTYPGWHMHGMIRDIMHYHSSHFPDPGMRVGQARAMLDFLVRTVPAEGNPYGMLLKQVVEDLRGRSDAYLLHEHLDNVNDPIYFHQFVERAAQYGLQYLGEAELYSMIPTHLPTEATQILNRLAGDAVHLQQYLDFLRNTRFRQSLLCRKELTLDRVRRPERLFGFLISSQAQASSVATDLRPGVNEIFRTPSGSLTSATPLIKAAMTHLAMVAPRALPFMDLLESSRGRLLAAGFEEPNEIEADRNSLAGTLLEGYLTTTLVDLHTWQPSFATAPSQRPLASALARLQATGSTTVTNVLHRRVGLHKMHQHLIRYLDGTRDCQALSEALVAEVRAGTLTAQRAGQPIEDEQLLRSSIEEAVADGLKQLARCALLIG